MECPKCHKKIDEETAVCPHCHKVLSLVCPNCHSLGQSPVCEDCGYIILTKCAKCGKTVPSDKEICKCGFPVEKSIEINECETDEFASLIIKFEGLKNIKRLLANKTLYTKFYNKLQNVLKSCLKNIEGNIILFGDTFVVNYNKELSFSTSVVRSAKLALKIINSFTSINQNVIEEFASPLKLNVTIVKKSAKDLLKNIVFENNVKLLNTNKNEKKYLKGMQIILDQYVQDILSKDYKTDSLYTIEQNAQTITFYEILLDKYVIPPNQKQEEIPNTKLNVINKRNNVQTTDDVKNSFKVFDINAKCNFVQVTASNLFKQFDNNKIISIRADKDYNVSTEEIVKYYENQDKKVLKAVCCEKTNFKPWGIFDQLLREFWNLSKVNGLIDKDFGISSLQSLKALLYEKPRKALTPEDARFAYMEDLAAFFRALKNYVIIIEGFENLDDTAIQTLSLYFDNFRNIVPNFVFITNKDVSVHSKIKGLLRTNVYTEYTIIPSEIDDAISLFKEDASDFIDSFYYEKINDNFDGSILYFENAINYLKESDVLISFEDKLIIKNNNSVLIPADLKGILKSRLKILGKTNSSASMIIAVSAFLGYRLDFKLLEFLGIEKVKENAEFLESQKWGYIRDEVFYLNNYLVLNEALQESMKQNVEEYIAKSVFVKLGKYLDSTSSIVIMGKLSMFKEEYLLLWKNSNIAMQMGDYDAYLKNCLGFLSLVDKINNNINPEEIEANKKEVFMNILMSLYSYSPEKIYSIENILLMDAMRENDDDKIVKLSNLMLQGALISSNYSEALNLLHNILTRIPHPTLLDGDKINTKFLLLSLVHIEILFNIGDYNQAVDTATDLLAVLRPDLMDEIKPAGFSTGLFVGHLLETFTLAAIAKLIMMDEDLEEFMKAVGIIIGLELPDQECILSIKDFLSGKQLVLSNIENATPLAKVIYLILQELNEHKTDYKAFAQNIYQAKLLASDIKQAQLEYICDALIAYSYANMGIYQKAESIYNDILEKAEKSAIFNVIAFARYLLALLRIAQNDKEGAIIIINDSLAMIQKYQNQAKIFYAMFEKLFIELAQKGDISGIDVEAEIKKLVLLSPNGELNTIVGDFQQKYDEADDTNTQQGENV